MRPAYEPLRRASVSQSSPDERGVPRDTLNQPPIICLDFRAVTPRLGPNDQSGQKEKGYCQTKAPKPLPATLAKQMLLPCSALCCSPCGANLPPPLRALTSWLNEIRFRSSVRQTCGTGEPRPPSRGVKPNAKDTSHHDKDGLAGGFQPVRESPGTATRVACHSPQAVSARRQSPNAIVLRQSLFTCRDPST